MTWIPAILCALGAVFVFISATGLLRMPDMFMRMQVVTKASTLGLLLVMAGVAVKFGAGPDSVRAGLVILFVFLTTPIGAHMLARAAHGRSEVKLWEGTLVDEMEEHSQRPAGSQENERSEPYARGPSPAEGP